jgi:hypothetical protein
MLVPVRNDSTYRFRCIANDFFVHFLRLLNKSAAEPPAGSFMNLSRGSIRFHMVFWEQTKPFLRLY